MSIENYPPINLVRQALRYEDGRLFWLVRPREHFPTESGWRKINGRYAGKEAGYTESGNGRLPRCNVRICTISIYRYTIVWALHKDEWRLNLDHENRNSLDDRIENLRIATQSQNNANRKINSSNISGYKGITWNSGGHKWQARICVDGHQIHIGLFDDPGEAHAAYMKAAREYYGEFACDGRPIKPASPK